MKSNKSIGQMPFGEMLSQLPKLLFFSYFCGWCELFLKQKEFYFILNLFICGEEREREKVRRRSKTATGCQCGFTTSSRSDVSVKQHFSCDGFFVLRGRPLTSLGLLSKAASECAAAFAHHLCNITLIVILTIWNRLKISSWLMLVSLSLSRLINE